MTEFGSDTPEIRRPVQTNWDAHYNQTDGALKVARRREVYSCLPPGEKPVYFDQVIIEAAETAGLSETATILDIGCSYPFDLKRWQEQSIARGMLYRTFIGIEPNIMQADGLNYWQPMPAAETTTHPLGRLALTREGVMFKGIQLIKTDANNLLQEPGTVDLAAFNFSFYHIAKELQRPALDEVRRALRKTVDDQTKVAGMLAISTSGNDNKAHMRHNELKIASLLSRALGSLVVPPEPLNAGFTTEDAEQLLPEVFEHVYKYEHPSGRIVIKNKRELAILMDAYRTLRDKYTDPQGQAPSEQAFESALRKIVKTEYDSARAEKRYVEDTLRQAAFIASDTPKQMPAGFVDISR